MSCLLQSADQKSGRKFVPLRFVMRRLKSDARLQLGFADVWVSGVRPEKAVTKSKQELHKIEYHKQKNIKNGRLRRIR